MKKFSHLFIVLFAVATVSINLGLRFAVGVLPTTEDSIRLMMAFNNTAVPFIAVFLTAFLLHVVNKKAKLAIKNTFFAVLCSGFSFVILSGLLALVIDPTPLLLVAMVGMTAAFFYLYSFLLTRFSK